MADRDLRVWTVATGSLVVFVLGIVLGSYATGTLQSLVLDIGTVPATLLFGYLWLLSIVGASYVRFQEPGVRAGGEMGAFGGLVALLFLTVVFVVGFVEPVGPFDPATRSVFRTVAAGTAFGAVAGILLWSWFRLCDRVGSVILDVEAE